MYSNDYSQRFTVSPFSHMKKDIQEKTRKLADVKKIDEKLSERLKQVGLSFSQWELNVIVPIRINRLRIKPRDGCELTFGLLSPLCHSGRGRKHVCGGASGGRGKGARGRGGGPIRRFGRTEPPSRKRIQANARV